MTQPSYNKSMPADMPARIRSLPVDRRGFPVPFFVDWIEVGDGVKEPDHRMVRRSAATEALSFNKCWICGQQLGQYKVFPIGPMCAINKISAEPPSHLDCAVFAVKACPFMANPSAKRNERGLTGEEQCASGGTMIRRNPGVMALWVTKSFRGERLSNGLVFRMGPPERIEWWKEGRAATRDEVVEAIDSGCPILQAEAAKGGERELKELADRTAFVKASYLPAPAP